MTRKEIQSQILQDADLLEYVGVKALHSAPVDGLAALVESFKARPVFKLPEVTIKLVDRVTDPIQKIVAEVNRIENAFAFNDGGRKAAGFTGEGAGDCVARSIAIASGMQYAKVYANLAEGHYTERRKRGWKGKKERTASKGIHTKRKWFTDLMASWGFVWVPTMAIGQGCKVHLKAEELPAGRLVVALSKHYTAMIDGVINDTYDPSRDGSRCVYGYWLFK